MPKKRKFYEPFAGVDEASEAAMIALLKELAANGRTILAVHHDLSKATEYFDQLLLLNKKVIGFGDAETVFQQELLRQAYVHPFLISRSKGGSRRMNFIEAIFIMTSCKKRCLPLRWSALFAE
ncbi:hypothetical protein BA724_10180 [Domibacillus iocasae]|uniref:ABC transporter domain-containing protein n=1 Tax=Domibacillus iocasae TaxID=1714016 RepID=A0A1E7DNG5_9BACI|nr:hypothetical protein BA724_10180 [Domibacillus iocasae]